MSSHRANRQEQRYAIYLAGQDRVEQHDRSDFLMGGPYGYLADARASEESQKAAPRHRAEKPTRKRGKSTLSVVLGRNIHPI